MSKQELVLMKQLEEKERSPSEEFLLLYLRAQQGKVDSVTTHEEDIQA